MKVNFSPDEIRAYFEAKVPNLQFGPKEARGACPIHHRTRKTSFVVNLSEGTWFCHSGCNRGGNIVTLEQALTGADGKEAYGQVCKIVGRRPPRSRDDEATNVEPEIIYKYKDDNDKVLYQVLCSGPQILDKKGPLS
jgi:DNA primase